MPIILKIVSKSHRWLLQDDDSLKYSQGKGKVLNKCIWGGHTHRTYKEQKQCFEEGPPDEEANTVRKEFEKLEREEAKPCPKCGDVFPTHTSDGCPNHPYLTLGDKGFKAAYDDHAVVILDWLKSVVSKMAGREDANAACPACTESGVTHNWRSCLKQLKCWKKENGEWETEPQEDPNNTPKGYVRVTCGNCTAVPDHLETSCLHRTKCEKSSPCSEHGIYSNTDHSFHCSCEEGYEGDGFVCTDIDECDQEPRLCSPNATCSDTDGSFTCNCKDGYTGNGKACFDIDECEIGMHSCSKHAMCTNTDGSY